ncbi:unnamed protein product, partial [Didymodactylos carnosus]
KLNAFRYYIQDLRSQLRKSFLSLKKNEHLLIVYRGLPMSSDEIKKLKSNVGTLVVFNGFLSTSRDKGVALVYSGQSANKLYNESVIIEIACDTTLPSPILADISESSCFPDESEVLFDLASVFEISSVEYNNAENYWTVKLKNSTKTKDSVRNLINLAKKELDEDNPSKLFDKLMDHMKKLNQESQTFAEQTIDKPLEDMIVHLAIVMLNDPSGINMQPKLKIFQEKVVFFHDVESCLDHIRQSMGEQIILIVSSDFVQKIFPELEKSTHVQSVYVFLRDNYPLVNNLLQKLVGIFTTENELISQLAHNLGIYYRKQGNKCIEQKKAKLALEYFDRACCYYDILSDNANMRIKDLNTMAKD